MKKIYYDIFSQSAWPYYTTIIHNLNIENVHALKFARREWIHVNSKIAKQNELKLGEQLSFSTSFNDLLCLRRSRSCPVPLDPESEPGTAGRQDATPAGPDAAGHRGDGTSATAGQQRVLHAELPKQKTLLHLVVIRAFISVCVCVCAT